MIIDDLSDGDLQPDIDKEGFLFPFLYFGYFLQRISQTDLNIIIISNEIGQGVVPAFPLGRIFRDFMGMINKNIAKVSDEVYLFIAGIKQKLK